MSTTTRDQTALDIQVPVTFWPDVRGQSCAETPTSLRELAKRVTGPSAKRKDGLPMLKFAAFGDLRTDKNSLRHDDNVLHITGVEGDYDAEVMPPEDAAFALELAEIAALVYTTPTSRPGKPRWRVLCPTSQPLPPDRRAALVARLNGALGGVLAGESLDLSLSYFFGREDGQPLPETWLVQGRFVDQADDLDASAIYPKRDKAKAKGAQSSKHGRTAPLEHVIAAVAAIPNNGPPNWHHFSRIGGAIFGAVGESDRESGREIFMEWSARNPAHNPEVVEERWNHWAGGSSYDELGFGTLHYEARKADPNWSRPGTESTGGAEFSEWQEGLQRERGVTIPNLANAAHALRLAPELVGILAYDEMTRQPLVTRSLPGSRMAAVADPRPLQDPDVSAIQEWLQRHDLRRVSKDTVHQAVALVALEHAFHPVQDYLTGLQWDGTPRIDSWLSSYLGADATPYTRAIGRMFLIAMVARIMRPGCKVDYMMVLEGDQGLRKSTVCEILGGQYFSDGLPDLSRSDAVRLSMHLRGKWVIEIGELSSISKAEADELKAFLTKRAEVYTPKFGRSEVTELRSCVFVGTTNKSEYLRDETGGRRFWPVAVTKVDAEALAADRDQLFAEAVAAFARGESWWPEAVFEAEHIKPIQDSRRETDEWQPIIAAWLTAPVGEFNESAPLARTTVAAVAQHALHLTKEKLGTREQRRITAALRGLGWKPGHAGAERWWERGV